ncbi:hypothetical protein SAMN05720472_2957 [Fibrobacter sp. UWR3]|jgi:hypothetical protein|uniref:hypothetical protein n=1 Tax=Fibrobacter sp. UWR3 TaxID=1896217 RepID=UPI00091C6A3E|nr:hypothetical protein [Fibrobacter sp. UWR3]SHN00565.1 hypothetical protein SAMN05720472_2957 [Fibrobacter sp. UWR3]
MICPECGERYNYYEPQCPWCGAAKPVEKEKPDEGAEPSGSQIENAEEKEVYFTYNSKRKHAGKLKIIFRHIVAIICILISISFGFIIWDAFDSRGVTLSVSFFVGAVMIFWDAFYSANVVRKIECHKDEFVLYGCYDRVTLPFDKADMQKRRIRWAGRRVLIFRMNEGIFFVDEYDFPEVAETMEKLYFGIG